MTTFAESHAPSSTRVFETAPPSVSGTVPQAGQFVVLFRDGVSSAGWLMDEPTETEPNPVGLVHLWAKMLTADGVVVFANRTRSEWLGAERDNRSPDVRVLMTVQRRAKEHLKEVARSAHVWADDNSLCGEFDDFLEEHDLPSRREREHVLPVNVSMTVFVPAQGVNEEDAFDNLERAAVVEAVDTALVNNPAGLDYEQGC